MDGPSSPEAPALFKGPDSNEAVIDTPCIREPPRGTIHLCSAEKRVPILYSVKHTEAGKGLNRNSRKRGSVVWHRRESSAWSSRSRLCPWAELGLDPGRLPCRRKRPRFHACLPPGLVCVLLLGPLTLRSVLLLFSPPFLALCCFLYRRWCFSTDT